MWRATLRSYLNFLSQTEHLFGFFSRSVTEELFSLSTSLLCNSLMWRDIFLVRKGVNKKPKKNESGDLQTAGCFFSNTVCWASQTFLAWQIAWKWEKADCFHILFYGQTLYQKGTIHLFFYCLPPHLLSVEWQSWLISFLIGFCQTNGFYSPQGQNGFITQRAQRVTWQTGKPIGTRLGCSKPDPIRVVSWFGVASNIFWRQCKLSALFTMNNVSLVIGEGQRGALCTRDFNIVSCKFMIQQSRGFSRWRFNQMSG